MSTEFFASFSILGLACSARFARSCGAAPFISSDITGPRGTLRQNARRTIQRRIKLLPEAW